MLNIVDWEFFQDSDFAESEITSLDAGLRMDGLLAFDLWDCGPCGAENDSRNITTCPSEHAGSTPKVAQVLDQNVDLLNIDQVLSNARLSEKESQLL